MIDEKINEALAELAKSLKDLDSARRQVDSTVEAYGQLSKATTEYAANMASVQKSIEKLVATIGDNYQGDVNRLKAKSEIVIASCKAKLDHAATTFANSVSATKNDFGNALDKMRTEYEDNIEGLENECKRSVETFNNTLGQVATALGATLNKVGAELEANNSRLENERKRSIEAFDNSLKKATSAFQNSISTTRNDVDHTLGQIRHEYDNAAGNLREECERIVKNHNSTLEDLSAATEQAKTLSKRMDNAIRMQRIALAANLAFIVAAALLAFLR